MTYIKAPKKLIEVALPLDAINEASAREKSIRHGHPSTLHLWWARRPLASARAVIFAQMVDDPSTYIEGDRRTRAWKEAVALERERLFKLITNLVQWENTNNEEVLERARAEIRRSWARACLGVQKARLLTDAEIKEMLEAGKMPALPAFHDPFAGGGTLPLEAQRLGLEAWASDLNPVAVTINKAMIEIPPRFAGRAPVSLGARASRPQEEAQESRPHKSWHSRGYLPHCDQPDLLQSITFRLADAVPARVIEGWRAELQLKGDEPADDPRCAELRERIERYADSGHGQCWLREPQIAQLVEDALLHFDGERYRLLAWCVMPNHVHVLIETMPGYPLGEVVQAWKSFTAKAANQVLGRSGSFWMPDYFDRYIRDANHLHAVREYIEHNPVKAGLVRRPQDWTFSSAKLARMNAGETRAPLGTRVSDPQAGETPAPLGTRVSDPQAGETPAPLGTRVSDPQAGETPAPLGTRVSDPQAGETPAPLGTRVSDPQAGETPALPGFEDWAGAKGLAEDVRYYGQWMRDEAEKRIGHLYPPVEITPELVQGRPDLVPLVGQKLTVIAWLWARTVRSPNPAFSHVEVPLASTFVLSSKAGKEAYVEPVLGTRASGPQADGTSALPGYRFTVQVAGNPGFDQAAYARAKNGTKLTRGANFECLLSKTPIDGNYIKAESMAGRMGARLMAIVAEGPRGRVYLPPIPEHEAIARQAQPEWKPDQPMNRDTRDLVSGRGYGFFTWADLFTPRQLVALTTFSDLVGEAIERCRQDALAWERGRPARCAQDARAPRHAPDVPLDQGGSGALAYAQAVGVYLGFAIEKLADRGSSICGWDVSRDSLRNTFGRQAIPMVWDFAESNPLSDSSGSFSNATEQTTKVLSEFQSPSDGKSTQSDAQTQTLSRDKVVSTDPPYYDNIGYADLSDFFYVWLRRTLRPILPGLYATLAVPKAEELVATPYRHGSKEAAEQFFLDGMRRALKNLAEQAHPAFPVTIYYAFKQSETTNESGTSSTGWETFLQAVLDAGFALTGTWPMRTEREGRTIAAETNTLASSIVLVCRKRPADAPTASRREFLRELNATLPEALEAMTRGGVHSPVAPVDLSQAIIGPGMAIFSQYAAVLEADGTPMTVKTALALINRFLAEDDFDADTQFCLHWFESQGWAAGKYGEADVLARAKGTAVDRLVEAGVVESSKGSVRLLKWAEYPGSADILSARKAGGTPTLPPVWEALHQLVRALNQREGGESDAGRLLARMPARAEPIRALAYRLYTLCEHKGWAEDARAYNELVTAWSGIEQAANQAGIVGTQMQLDI